MKKRGFTLIELLAVIVVLAIIALIATPIVMNVIKNTKRIAIERSVERYLSAVELAITTNNLDNPLIEDGTYVINEDGNLILNEKILIVEVSGDRPTAGSKVTIRNGKVISEGTSIKMGDYTVTIDSEGKIKAEIRVILCTAIEPNDQSVWNKTDKIVELKTVGVQATSDEPYALGSVYTCELGDEVSRIFYVLGEDGDNVRLIMNENIEEAVRWCIKGSNNSCAADGAKRNLANQTSGWTKISQNQITLPTYDEMILVKGQTWMRTNLAENGESVGYWTSEPLPSDVGRAWFVTPSGTLNGYGIVYGNQYGIRPVITISKTNMSL